ncbi:hypothetical protein DRE_04129 [Drechslerella stenobrocha 248]|uniref:Uncharacterized protein n=1 Tax=Drechslerella stenobrocha 248 TaxID=1043628 RepID=W7I2L4_9PEZI|nr:hypothetical protein DRE_04129 [Drechslerella stenobrocha 248]
MPYGLPQSYQPSNNMIGNGFASRSTADNRRNMNIPSLPTISTSLYEDAKNHPLSPAIATPRTSGRAQLLAGLRTAPKTPYGMDHSGALDGHHDSGSHAGQADLNMPAYNQRMHHQGNVRSAHSYQGMQQNMARPVYVQEQFHDLSLGNFSGPPTPPSSGLPYQGEAEYEAKLYADLLARNISLAQQQQLLQQMIVSQQVHMQHSGQHVQPIHVQTANAQTMNASLMSPTVYSPSTPRHQVPHGANGPYGSSNAQYGYPSQQARSMHGTPRNASPPRQTPVASLASSSQVSLASSMVTDSPARTSSSRSSPSPTRGFANAERAPMAQKTPSPPPPTAISKFRRGHKKCISLSGCNNTNAALADSGPKTSLPRLSNNVPSTPIGSTFGGRGDHPVRQPRGPPALEEIVAKPTAKHEGSKNFSSRQRRRALTKLVNAGIERRGTKPVAAGSEQVPASPERSGVPPVRRSSTDDVQAGEPHVAKRESLVAPSTDKRRSAIF